MTRKRRNCADCGEPLPKNLIELAASWPGRGYEFCRACRENYTTCSRCDGLHHVRDMRQAYCVDCRRAYDRERWARQRAARA